MFFSYFLATLNKPAAAPKHNPFELDVGKKELPTRK